MPYTPILGTIGYILSPDKRKVLLVHRNARPHDTSYGMYMGLGGKMESHEDVLSCMKREIFEEAGIVCTDVVFRGTINWTNFGKHGEDWLGFVFRIDAFEGTPFENNPEGDLEWVDLEKLRDLPMWEGDHHFLPMVFDKDPRPFYGHMPYEKLKPVSWSYLR
jgi:8-oxo-dGTP diphosphatase